MKIIFITREGYNLPGARIRCYNFSKSLSGLGIETEVLSFADTLGAKDGEEESQMGLWGKIRFNSIAFKRLINVKEAFFYIQRFNYHSFAPYLAHLLQKNNIILDLDDWEMRENQKYYLGFYPASKAHYMTYKLAKRSIFCIAASRFLENFLSGFNKNVYYIPSGVDTDFFISSLPAQSEKEIIFSWIGTLHKLEYVENIKFALDCFAEVRKKYDYVFFDIVGDGIYRDLTLRLIKSLGDKNVRFKGWIMPDAMPQYLNGIHVGLFPVVSSVKFNLSKSPTKLFEYMAMAKPTISCNIGETTEIIKDGENGLLANTKEEFTEKMRILIEEPDLRKKLGECARRTVETNYSLEVLGRRLYGIFKQYNA